MNSKRYHFLDLAKKELWDYVSYETVDALLDTMVVSLHQSRPHRQIWIKDEMRNHIDSRMLNG